MWHFASLAADRLSEIEQELEDDDSMLGVTARRRLAFLAAALRHDPDDGWQHWVTHEGDPGLASFRQHIQDWLDEDVDLYESEYFDNLWNGQSVSLEFFSSLESSICEALGVELVYGEHPGSSYYAAELKVDIEQANAAAESLGLDFRFQAEDDIAPATQALDTSEANAGVTA